ncbi:MAG: glucosaminidase domain-containing protein [Methylacidiphilales bacterium]|nr:glucosaminidase domain-containing protein [Candidatus Methylacidiphilales bacterium]
MIRFRTIATTLAAFLAAIALGTVAASAAPLPPIKADDGNAVPACVTPTRLTAFLKSRHDGLDSRLETIAEHYERHGRALGVRWDYAFFQMIIETNWLRFHQANGRPGLVSPAQNNFAGIGATGRGRSGEAFADVSTGVLAHLQHVSMYAGETVDSPVAVRTRLVQGWGEIPQWAHGLRRPVTFTDLTRKWSPHDRGYSDDIAAVAERFFATHCEVRFANNETTSDSLAPDPAPTGSARTSLFRKLMF